MSRLSQGAAAVTSASGGENVSHTRNQLEAAVRAKRSVEAIELIPEVKKEEKKQVTPGGIRTHNPWLRRPMPYPLGHRGLLTYT